MKTFAWYQFQNFLFLPFQKMSRGPPVYKTWGPLQWSFGESLIFLIASLHCIKKLKGMIHWNRQLGGYRKKWTLGVLVIGTRVKGCQSQPSTKEWIYLWSSLLCTGIDRDLGKWNPGSAKNKRVGQMVEGQTPRTSCLRLSGRGSSLTTQDHLHGTEV